VTSKECDEKKITMNYGEKESWRNVVGMQNHVAMIATERQQETTVAKQTNAP
jgi:hypothetical protein